MKYRQSNGKENKLHFMLAKWQPQTAHDILHRFEQDVFPQLVACPASKGTLEGFLERTRRTRLERWLLPDEVAREDR
ncbi:hypothetical protein LJR122_002931 [Massilia sp. LjRoot122]